jgi:NodT family efflux transporter outer membrane factor (OMF) lipoprotein
MKTHNIYMLALMLAFILTGCKTSKAPVTPILEIPQEFRNAFAVSDTTTVANFEWEVFFPDHQLQNLITQAVKGNHDMLTALKNIENARLQLRQSKWEQIPQLNAYVNSSTSIPSENSLNGMSTNSLLETNHIEDYSLGFSFSWEADIWGKIHNRKKEALAAYLVTEEAKKAIQVNLIATVAHRYYNLLMLDEQLNIAEKNKALSEKTVRVISRQFEAGQVTNLAVEQATAQQLQAERIVPQLEKEIAIQENALSILIGVMPADIERDGNILEMKLHDSLPVGIPASLLSFRPDVKALEYELEAANARVGIAKAYIYPSLNITANAGLNSFMADNWFNIPASLFGTLTGSLVQPLLQGRRLKTQYEVAKNEREKIVIAFKKQVLIAVSDVSNALIEIEKLREEIMFAEARVKNLQKALSNADKLFSSGLANYLEIITAQSSILQSELDLAEIKRNQLSAEARLYKALGGGWK